MSDNRAKCDIALIGLGVMGASLVRNIERHGYRCCIYNRTRKVTEEFIATYDGNFYPAYSYEELVSSLMRPRKILIMVKAGAPVDAVLDSLIPLLDRGDVVCDLGNSFFKDTERRLQRMTEIGVHYLGVGVSGGEEGALKGPSIMSGGSREGFEIIRECFDAISAKVPEPCHAYVGSGGAGHFVKMVHNGIEYADMQIIAEIYHALRDLYELLPPRLSEIFKKWNDGRLSSYLLEINSKIFTKKDDNGDGWLIDKILDVAKQKGTGRWTSEISIEMGYPVPTIVAAVAARAMSEMKEERIKAADIFEKSLRAVTPLEIAIEHFEKALFCARVISYAQGFGLIKYASDRFKWGSNLSKIAAIWRGGCIIRSSLLEDIMKAYKAPQLENLLLADSISKHIKRDISGLRETVSALSMAGIPCLCLSSALSYFDTYTTERLPQNLTQAQRDYFGAHTYERIDQEGIFHTDWEN